MTQTWVRHAIRRIDADFARSADTHLQRLELPGCPGLVLFLKDESTHPTGSLKHRLARSLFLYGICNGWIREGSLVVDASSGSTAISEAYFARLLGLPFCAVMPRATSPEKIAQIEFYGGRCHLVDDAGSVYAESQRLADESGGHYLDQFTYAERATDWRGNNNIAETLFAQMRLEDHPVPRWIVCGAGTGGTSATIGRFLRYRQLDSRLCVVDPEGSVFFDCYRAGRREVPPGKASRIEGIGRARVEPSFIPELVDRMIRVADAASIAAAHVLSERIGRRVGGSTGTNLMGALQLLHEMQRRGEKGAVATLICDSGARYEHSYFNEEWLRGQELDVATWRGRITEYLQHGRWSDALAQDQFERGG
jgi:cysteine synthase A